MTSILERIWPTRKPRCDIHQAAREIGEKERELAKLRLRREAAEASLVSAFEDLLKTKERPRGDH